MKYGVGEFLVGEIPEVLEQLLMWKAAESVMWCLLGAVFVGFGMYVCRYFWGVSEREPEEELKPLWLIIMAFAALATAVAGSATINLTALQIYLAPKVYLLEYAAEVVK